MVETGEKKKRFSTFFYFLQYIERAEVIMILFGFKWHGTFISTNTLAHRAVSAILNEM